jgi:hypothetical protein
MAITGMQFTSENFVRLWQLQRASQILESSVGREVPAQITAADAGTTVNADATPVGWSAQQSAAMHMVVNRSGRERYSIPLFVHPSYHTAIDPMTLVGEAPAGEDFAPIIAGEQVYKNFMARRLSWQEAQV